MSLAVASPTSIVQDNNRHLRTTMSLHCYSKEKCIVSVAQHIWFPDNAYRILQHCQTNAVNTVH